MKLLEAQRRFAAALLGREARGLIRRGGRLEVYRRAYWARLVDSLRDDFPGLVAVMGRRAFDRMARMYLTECPSRSFTLRNLGERLAEWLAAGGYGELEVDMARLEWAHVEAFDRAEEEPVSRPAARLGLQPHLRLLALGYGADRMRIRVNGMAAGERIRGARREEVFVAVYRLDLQVHYRRLAREEFSTLEALRRGEPVARAIGDAGAEELRAWFGAWAELGWLTERRKR